MKVLSVIVDVYAKIERGRKWGWQCATEDGKKKHSKKSNDSLQKLIYLSINDGYIPRNGFIN